MVRASLDVVLVSFIVSFLLDQDSLLHVKTLNLLCLLVFACFSIQRCFALDWWLTVPGVFPLGSAVGVLLSRCILSMHSYTWMLSTDGVLLLLCVAAARARLLQYSSDDSESAEEDSDSSA